MTGEAALPPLAPPPAVAAEPEAEEPLPAAPPAKLAVHLKHTVSSRQHALVDPEAERAADIKALLRRDAPAAAVAGSLPPLGAGCMASHVRHSGETTRELLAKKRQIFLAQMSLDTKHAEVAKLEQRARQREEALAASEAALEQDSQRFEEYLRQNDTLLQAGWAAGEALRQADAAARARADKAAEAKRLGAAIGGVRGEVAKMQEALGECQRFKAFLDGVTPEEWFEGLAAQRAAKKAALRAEWRAACDALAARKGEAAAARQRAEHAMQWARTQQQFERAEREAREAAAALHAALAEQDPPEPDYAAVDQEEEPLFFQARRLCWCSSFGLEPAAAAGAAARHAADPAQLLAAFSQLERSNMFQIQTAQEAEAALEAARAAGAAATAALDAEAAALRQQVADVEAALAAARERCAALGGAPASPSGSPSAGASASPAPSAQPGAAAGSGEGQLAAGGGDWEALSRQLAAAYEAAGFAPDASVTPLQMLQKVEARLLECLAAVGPPGGPGALAAEAMERAREKERRQAARAGKLAARQAEHEARIQRVLQRAQAPRFQRRGKPAMARSVLQRAERAQLGGGEAGEEAELAAFLALIDETFHC